MNAPLRVTTTDPFALGQVPPWSSEAERNILGAAMLDHAPPPWLRAEMLFASQHARILDAIRDVGPRPDRVNAWLRDCSPPTGPLVATSVDLAGMMLEAQFALRMGWSLVEECELVRELWRQRELMALMARLVVMLRAGQLEHEGARRELKAHFLEVR